MSPQLQLSSLPIDSIDGAMEDMLQDPLQLENSCKQSITPPDTSMFDAMVAMVAMVAGD